MPVSEMLQRMGSMEVAEWIAELSLRAQEEADAMKDAQSSAERPRVLGG